MRLPQAHSYQDFFQTSLLFIDIYLKPFEVEGDRNCFFRSVTSSDKINFDCHLTLRNELIRKMKEEITNKSSVGKMIEIWWQHGSAHRQGESLNVDLENMNQPCTWATDLEIMAFQLIFKIQVVTLQNAARGFVDGLNVKHIFQNIYKAEIDLPLFEGKIFIYHHFLESLGK